MALGKWIGGLLGWAVGGPIGAFAGFFIGSYFESLTSDEGAQLYGQQQSYRDDEQAYYAQQQAQGSRNSYLFSFLVLATYIIKADGRIMHSEMELVRQWFSTNFGSAASTQANDILLRLFDEQKRMEPATYKARIQQSCAQIAQHTDLSERLQLLSLLVLIAQADGHVASEEIVALREVAEWMQLSPNEIDSMLHLKGDSLDDAYKVMGLTPDATDDEVKKAYRKLAMEHHPDRVAQLGEDMRRMAEEKFQEINSAKERIYKARGL